MRVERIEIVSSFRHDVAVVLSKGPSLQRLAARLRGKILNINTGSKAPPELPRLVLRIERGIVQIGLNRFQVVVQPPSHIEGHYEQSVSFAAQLAKSAIAELYDESGPTFTWTGVVVVLNYPASHPEVVSGIDAVRPLYGRLTTLNWPQDELASFLLNVGRKRDGFYVNYHVAGYDMREVAVEVPAGVRSVAVDVSKSKVRESGVTVTLDVNSQPSTGQRAADTDLDSVLTRHAKTYASLAYDLNLINII